ncbi:LytR/AlgR family response regulator transcription factor [Mucilaginibacter lacusdianchii]|uniref:LytR/AlgR family response regulator transcription factor n=1 Tax=Mucilaginibacter lacusdianchii TaxID=2684211 RepID=UPI00131C19B0|nr:LytTR family DNA-binding domain-containing protein [Mucilaginibacter sp. JXJ CY 39]
MIAIAIDDEPLALDVIKSHAAKVSFIDLKETFTNAFKAIAYLQQQKVDLIFLDVKMPDISGIDFLSSISNPPMVIFTTAYSEHAVKSFELDAVDYLLKPFSLPRFLKACNKAYELYRLRKQPNEPEDTWIFIKDGFEQIKIQLAEILFIEAAGNYTKIFLMENKSVSTRATVGEMLMLLPAKKFIRTHRAYIVARDKITRFDRNQVIIGDKEIPIGVTYANCLKEM